LGNFLGKIARKRLTLNTIYTILCEQLAIVLTAFLGANYV
jgi:hypothetical protein